MYIHIQYICTRLYIDINYALHSYARMYLQLGINLVIRIIAYVILVTVTKD